MDYFEQYDFFTNVVMYVICEFEHFYEDNFPIPNYAYEITLRYYKGTYMSPTQILLGHGYCWYLANFLKKVFPLGVIFYLTPSHLAFHINQQFYDYRGLIPCKEKKLLLPSNDWIDINSLVPFSTTDSSINEFISSEKDTVWNKIEPDLWLATQAYIAKIQNNSFVPRK